VRKINNNNGFAGGNARKKTENYCPLPERKRLGK